MGIEIDHNLYEICVTFFVFLFIFLNIEHWTQSLPLYHLNHVPVLLFLVYFSNKVSCLCPGPASNGDPPTSASKVGRITGLIHYTQFCKAFISYSPYIGFRPSNIKVEMSNHDSDHSRNTADEKLLPRTAFVEILFQSFHHPFLFCFVSCLLVHLVLGM
jgi:hypothetical protein